MAGKIRGITIELGADASGVLDSISKLNSEIKSTQSQIKDVDKLLKLDPGNMTLITQKTQLLQEQIGNTKSKLEELKAAQADMDANGVDKNSAQYQALQREIIATEQQLKTLESTAGSGSAALAKVSQVTGQIGDKMEAVGKKLSVVSAAITALGAAAIAAFNDVDSGADIVIKKTGATGEAAEELEQSYKNVAKNIVADFDDIGSAVGEVNTRFKVTGEDLEDLSEEFLKFANINDMDVTSAVSGVDKALKTFNLDQSKAKDVMGLLSKTSQDTGISMDTLLGLLQSSGATLKEMGLDLGSSVTLMGQFEAAGIDSNEMLSKMSKAAVYFQKNGKDMNEGLSDLISRLQDSSTEADATAEAYEIFGSKAGLAFVTAAKEGKINISDLSASLSDYGHVVDDTYQQTLDGTDKMALAWQNMKLGLAELGGAIGETLAPIMDKITAGIQKVVEWFTNLDDGTKEMIVTVGGLVAAIGPLLVIGGKVMNGISSITGALSAIGTTTAGPIGIAIAAVAAATAGIIALASAFQDAAHDAIPYIDQLDALAKAHDDYVSAMSNAKNDYEETVKATEASAGAAEYLASKLQELVAAYDGTAGQSEAIQSMVNQLNELVPGLGLSWDGVTGSLSLTNEEIYKNIEAMRAQAQVAALQDYYTEALKANYEAQLNAAEAQKILNQLCSDYGITMSDLDYILQDNEHATQRLLEVSDNLSGSIIQNKPNADALALAMQGLDDCQNDVAESGETITWIEGELGTAMQAAAQATQASMSAIEQACTEAFGSIEPALQDVITQAETAGVQIPQSLIEGISNGSIDVETAIQQLIELTNQTEQAAVNAETTGETYVEQLTETVSDGADDVESAAQTTVDELDKTDEAYSYGEETGSSYNEGLGDQTGNIEATAENIADTVTDTMNEVPPQMDEAGDSSGANLNNAFDSWSDTVYATVDDMYEIFYKALGQELPNNMLKWGDSSGNKFEYGLSGQISAITTAANNITAGIDDALAVLPGHMEAAGYNGGAGLYNGLAEWSGTLYSLASSIAYNISSTIRAALQVKSPSKVMEKIGGFVGEGLEIGLAESASGIYAAAEKIAEGTQESLSGINAINSARMAANQQNRQQAESNSQITGLTSLLNHYLPYLAEDTQITFDDGTWAGKLAPAISQEMQGMRVRSGRG